MHILIPVVALGAIGLVLGVLLAAASKYLSVEQDERIGQIEEALPGANCGACSYAGCAVLAAAIAEGKAPVNACPVGGAKSSEIIAGIMGVENSPAAENVAVVMCRGISGAAQKKYLYEGFEDCDIANRLAGGGKACEYGCLGLGNCVRVCQFDAIKVEDSVAVVDPEKCTACGLCVAACPKKVIHLVPKERQYTVRCISQDKGVQMKNLCSVGCIACRLCEKACRFDAIKVKDNFAIIDYDKCTDCGKCFEACPKKIIYKMKC